MPTLTFQTPLNASAEAVFSWHERPGAFLRLAPPWAGVALLEAEGIRDGDRAVIRLGQGPARITWVAEHRGYVEGRQFTDVQVRGPFRRWEHTHRFVPDGPASSTLVDHIEYALPLAPLSGFVAGRAVRRQLEARFAYRHRITRQDLRLHEQYNPERNALRIAVTGASGLIGRALTSFLTAGGHHVVPMVRTHERVASIPGALYWNPETGEIDAAGLEGADAVIHLAGMPAVALRWTDSRKRDIYDSRIDGTQLLGTTLARLRRPPAVFLSASAIGYYGNRHGAPVGEDAPPGDSFFADLCRAWEAATEPAAAAGIRTVILRIGVVLSPRSGALRRMLLPFRLGLGASWGDAQQRLSWISPDDTLGAIYHTLMTPSLAGPFNLVAPQPSPVKAFSHTLGDVLGRPVFLHLPPAVIRAVMGEAGKETVLLSSPLRPERLLQSGYHFLYPGLEATLRHQLGKQQSQSGT